MSSLASPSTPSGIGSFGQSGSAQMRPSWEGFVSDTKDALILFEAVAQGKIPRVSRRPHDRERNSLIKSGSIFIYDENASGIKRWTDGVNWSPSRILGNFLIYRELEKPFPPGEKKRATKKPKRPSSSEDRVESPAEPKTPTSAVAQAGGSGFSDKELDRSLVGSLQDSYTFKDGGLIKKTMSVNLEGAHYHLVSYYCPEDVKLQTLQRPVDQDLRFIQIRPDLIHRQNFRAPVENFDLSPSATTPMGRSLGNSGFMTGGGGGGAAAAAAAAAGFMGATDYLSQAQSSLAGVDYGMHAMQQQQSAPPRHHQTPYSTYGDTPSRIMASSQHPHAQQQQQQQQHSYYSTMAPPSMPLYQPHYAAPPSIYDRQYQEHAHQQQQQQQHHHQQQQQQQHQQQQDYKMDYKSYAHQPWPGQGG